MEEKTYMLTKEVVNSYECQKMLARMWKSEMVNYPQDVEVGDLVSVWSDKTKGFTKKGIVTKVSPDRTIEFKQDGIKGTST